MCVKGTTLAVKGQHSCGVSRGLYWLPRANTPVCPGDDVKGQHSCVSRGLCQGPTPLCVQGTALAVKDQHPVCVQGTALVIKGQHSRGLHWLSRANTPTGVQVVIQQSAKIKNEKCLPPS